jgi:hypothetical protein
MQIHSSQLRLGVVILISVGLVGYAVWQVQLGFASTRELRAEETRVADSNREVLRGIETSLFQSIIGDELSPPGEGVRFPMEEGDAAPVGIDIVESVINKSRIVNNSGVDDALVRSLKRFVAEFVYFRFIRDDASDYVAWRLSRGDRFKEKDLIFGKWLVASDYEVYFNELFPEDADVQEVFERVYNFHREGRNDGHRPVGMGVDESGLITGIQRMNPALGFERIDLGSEELNTLWYEPNLGSHRGWFEVGVDLAGDDELLSGLVGVVLEYADGTLRPVIVSAYLDPKIGHWSVSMLWTNIYGDTTGGLIEY